MKILWTFTFLLLHLAFFSFFLKIRKKPLHMRRETSNLMKQCEQKHIKNWFGYSPIKYPPPTLGPMTVSSNAITGYSQQNMILGMAAGYGLDILRPFLDSVLYSKVDAEIVLLGLAKSKDHSLLFDQEVQDFAYVHGITLKVIEVDELKKIRDFCAERGI